MNRLLRCPFASKSPSLVAASHSSGYWCGRSGVETNHALASNADGHSAVDLARSTTAYKVLDQVSPQIVPTNKSYEGRDGIVVWLIWLFRKIGWKLEVEVGDRCSTRCLSWSRHVWYRVDLGCRFSDEQQIRSCSSTVLQQWQTELGQTLWRSSM